MQAQFRATPEDVVRGRGPLGLEQKLDFPLRQPGAEILARGERGRPERAVVDSRSVGPGDLFVGLPGARVDGGAYAAAALEAGAWGVLVTP